MLSRLLSTGGSRDFGTIPEKGGSLAAAQSLEPKMNARKEIRDHLLAARMKAWLDIARCPIMNTKVPTWKARKNFWSLCRRHPEIAARLGYTEALIIPSPLHGLPSAKPPVIDPPTPAREQPPAARTPAYAPPAMSGGVPRTVLLDGEVL